MELLLGAAALWLAFGNGANDNFKGFATVWGSDTLSYRRALVLATVATLAGSLLSVWLAQGLVQQFSGRGLLPAALVARPEFLTSVALGAAATVMLATRAGLPVSTTHALIGGLVGAGLAASPAEVQLLQLGRGFVLPLLVSPLVAAAAAWAVYRVVQRRQAATGPLPDCACVVAPALQAAPAMSAVALSRAGVLPGASVRSHAGVLPQLVLADSAGCDRQRGVLARGSLPRLVESLHIGSASLICLSRAVNDTPKLAALLLAAPWLPAGGSLVPIALAMGLGGLLLSRRVAETMARRMARLDAARGVSANLVTAALVLGASQLGLPVSTTHVSVGSIAGVGAGARTLDAATLRSVLLSWLATLPLAAAGAWVAYRLL